MCLGIEFTIQSNPWLFFPTFVFLLLHFVSSFLFLIYKQLVRKEVFPVVAWNIANWSQSSKQWFHTELPNVLNGSLFPAESFESKLNSDSSDEKEMIRKQNLDVLVPNYIRIWLILLAIFSSKYTEQTEAPLRLVPGQTSSATTAPRLPKSRSCNTSSAPWRSTVTVNLTHVQSLETQNWLALE